MWNTSRRRRNELEGSESTLWLGPFVTNPDKHYIEHYIEQAGDNFMNIKAIIHDAEEGGFWAEVPAIPGCATQGETMEELVANLHEAIEGCLSVDIEMPQPDSNALIMNIAI